MHRRCAFWKTPHEVDDFAGNISRAGQPAGRFREFVLFRKTAEPEKVTGLFESRIRRQFVDVVSAIRKNSLLAFNKANAGLPGYNIFQTSCHEPKPSSRTSDEILLRLTFRARYVNVPQPNPDSARSRCSPYSPRLQTARPSFLPKSFREDRGFPNHPLR